MGFNPLKNIVQDTEGAGVELFGNKRMIVSDCKCVADFSEDCIVLELGGMNMKIKGDALEISSFAFGQTDICGEFVSIEFEKI